MKLLAVPGTPMKGSNIWLGTAVFGSTYPEADCFRILDRYLELGGNVIDTANVYSSWLPGGEGKSELTIGKWLRQSGARNRVFISTKGAHPNFKTMHISRLSWEEIRENLGQSLERLGIDSVDIYWLHRDDPKVPVAGIMDCLNGLLSEGLVKAIGASNWSTERIEAAQRYAEDSGLVGFCCSQINFSLASPNPGFDFPGTITMRREDKPFYRDAGLLLAAYSSQARGFFSGKYHRGMVITEQSTNREKQVSKGYFNETNFDRLDRVKEMAGELKLAPNQVALAYLFSQPFDVAAIVGSRTVDQIEASCSAADLRLTEEQVRFLEKRP